MSLFQHSILNRYLYSLDKAAVNSKWELYKSHFLHPDIQENIRNSKEEQYQEGFLRDLFVKVLGYKLNPTAGFNLTTEYKNIKDSKKADGAIIIDGKVKAVIELKGNDTTDLSKIEPQAFGYKNNQPDCKYIIISNFEKLRFYIENTVSYIEFNLFKLTETEFQLLWLCLSYEKLTADVPATIKNASVDKEENITKELYKDYSQFKRELYQNLVELNPQYNELELFKKSQKLLDRFLFILFAEDRNLLPDNSIRIILDDWNKLKELDEYKPLYSRYIKYFGYMNTGFKGKQSEIFAYNGGLFKPDEILDNVLIDDDLLYKHTYKLSSYDFESDVDVNILGHIFENSLNEIDEMLAKGAGTLEDVEKSHTVSKRKKDGVFYTPKYITKYIVENTVGKLCAEKKTELEIDEQEYTSDKKKSKDTKQKLLAKLTDYRQWLLHITIVDPACGSGAFLNEALNFLIGEHTYIDELETKITGGSIIFSNVENSILENNLFGVDLNEESVEIARLSLWLRTAKPNRKLNDLSNNIKCGNSLIDDPEVAGEKAFHWQKEFPQVFTPKNKKIWHVTTATHNSRYSQRMFDNHVKLGEAEWIDTADELIITQTVAEIAKADTLNILQYNLCGDHLHLLIVCEEEELPRIVGKIKSVTAKNRNRARGYTTTTAPERGGMPPRQSGVPPRQSPRLGASLRGETQYSLWTQKYGCTEVDNEEYLHNAIEYIRTNRVKHELPANAEMEKIIKTFLCTEEHALRTEYKGGFDVVIGNPPYVRGRELDENERRYLDRYGIASNDTAILFVKKGFSLINPKGYISYIIPKSLLYASNWDVIRNEISKYLYLLIDCGKVWNEVLLEQIIFGASNNLRYNYKCGYRFENAIKELDIIDNKYVELFNYLPARETNESLSLATKIKESSVSLNSVYENVAGVPNQKYINDVGEFNMIGGAEFDRLEIKGIKGKIDKIWVQTDNAFVKENTLIVQNIIAHILYPTEHIKITACIPSSEHINKTTIANTVNQLITNDNVSNKYTWCLLNSTLINWYVYHFVYAMAIRTMHFYNPISEKVPFIFDEIDQQPFIEKADLMLELNKALQEVSGKFQRNVMREFGLAVLSGKLQSWFELSYPDFLKELAKAKVSLTLGQKAEWEDYFTAEQQQATALQHRIRIADKEIDAMVYQLYGLTDEEVKIVEGGDSQ